MTSEENKPQYDFNYLCRALNLLPCPIGAFNPTAVISIHHHDDGAFFELRNNESIEFTPDQLAELEQTIKREVERQTEESKIKQREALRENIKMQIEIAAEMQSGIQPSNLVGVSTGRKFR